MIGIRASAHELVDILMRQPVLAFAIALLLVTWSRQTAFILLFASLFALSSVFVSAHWHDLNKTLEALKFLKKFPDSQFDSLKIEDIISHYDEVAEVQGALFSAGSKKELGFIYISRVRENALTTSRTVTAFPRLTSDSIIIAPYDPRDSGCFRKFLFFHELGHFSEAHARIITMLPQTVWQAIFLVYCLAVLSGGKAIILLVGFIGILFRACYFTAMHFYAKRMQVLECVADAFAICRLREQKDFSSIKTVYKSQKLDKLQNQSFDYFTLWAEEPIDIYPTLAKFPLFRLPAFRHSLSKRSVNFKSGMQRFYSPPFWVNGIALSLIVFVGLFTRRLGTTEVITLGGVLVVFPMVLAIWLKIACRIFDCELKQRLNGNRTPTHLSRIVDLL